jgi:hypothetical protein
MEGMEVMDKMVVEDKTVNQAKMLRSTVNTFTLVVEIFKLYQFQMPFQLLNKPIFTNTDSRIGVQLMVKMENVEALVGSLVSPV